MSKADRERLYHYAVSVGGPGIDVRMIVMTEAEKLADLTEAIEGFLAWSAEKGPADDLCACDPEAGICPYHNMMDVADRVQGKRPRRSR